jgi:hypothetical protein
MCFLLTLRANTQLASRSGLRLDPLIRWWPWRLGVSNQSNWEKWIATRNHGRTGQPWKMSSWRWPTQEASRRCMTPRWCWLRAASKASAPWRSLMSTWTSASLSNRRTTAVCPSWAAHHKAVCPSSSKLLRSARQSCRMVSTTCRCP